MSENTDGDLRTYVVFVVEDEPAWEAKTDAERQVTYDADYAFGQALEKRGGKVVGGSGLAHTSRWQILRNDAGITRRTDGPYTESVEQLGGFYIVDAGSLDEAIELAAQIPGAGTGVVEVRPVMEFTEDGQPVDAQAGQAAG